MAAGAFLSFSLGSCLRRRRQFPFSSSSGGKLFSTLSVCLHTALLRKEALCVQRRQMSLFGLFRPWLRKKTFPPSFFAHISLYSEEGIVKGKIEAKDLFSTRNRSVEREDFISSSFFSIVEYIFSPTFFNQQTINHNFMPKLTSHDDDGEKSVY